VSWSGRGGCAGRREIGSGLSEYLVDAIDKIEKVGIFVPARMSEPNRKIGADVRGVRAEDDDAIGQKNGFFDIVCDQKN
jgi:hypothetical protein